MPIRFRQGNVLSPIVHAFLRPRRTIAKIYDKDSSNQYRLLWQNINPPGIDFITADTLLINLDTRPSGNIRLSYATEGLRNLLSTGSTDIPILNRITTESSKDFNIPSALYFGTWSDQTNIWAISGNEAKAFNPKKTGADKTDTTKDIDLTTVVGSTPGGWRGGVYLNGYHWIINVSATNFVAFCFNSSRVQLAARNIILPRSGYERAFGFGNTIWFINNVHNTADAYDVTGTSKPTRDSSKDFNLGAGIWYGGDISERGIYLLNATGSAPALHAYTQQDRQRRSERDYSLSTAGSPFPAYRGLVNFDSNFYALDTEQNKFKALQFFEKQNMNAIRVFQRDINLGTGEWRGGAGNKDTIWFLDNSGSTDKYLRAYRKGVLLTRDSSKDHNLGPGTFNGVCASGNLIWVLRTDINELRALNISSTGILVRNVGQDITGLPAGYEGCVTDGTDIWLVSISTNTAVSYSISSKTISNKNIGLGRGAWNGGTFYNGLNLYFVNRNAVPPSTRAHLASDRSHQSSKQFTLFNTGRVEYRGALSVGKEAWFIDDYNNRAYCYYVDIDVGSARIPQPAETTSYRIVSLNASGSSHQDVTITATQSPTVTNLDVRFVSDHSSLPTSGTIYITGQVHGYPRPEVTINQGWTYRIGENHISSRHFTKVSGVANTWSFETTHHFSSNPGRTFRVTVTNSSGSSYGDVIFH